MTAGRLAAAKPAATTNTSLYKCPINKSSSTVLNICNQSGSSVTYRAALRDYDNILTVAAGSYELQKGNIFSDYLVTISPGVSRDEINPGFSLTTNETNTDFAYQDIFQPVDVITFPVKVASIGAINTSPGSQTGPGFDLGATLTGLDTGLTATLYSVRATQIYVNIPTVSNTATSVVASDNTNAANDYVVFNNEVALVTARTGYTLTITRGQLGTTANTIQPGVTYVGLRPSVTTTTINEGATFSSTDTILTVTDSTGMSVGDVLKIDNELMSIGSITGNDVTVTRGVYGTTAATHTDTTTINIYTSFNSGALNFFSFTETLDDGIATVIDLAATGAYVQSNKFVYDRGLGYEFPQTIGFEVDRIYKFDLSDVSNTGNTLRLSTTVDGVHATPTAGVAYTTGVTTSGTPGSSGAYLQIDVSFANVGTTLTALNTYSIETANYGAPIAIDGNPFYEQIYVYDIEGSLMVNDSFTVGTTEYTITAIKPGPYGYVMGDLSASNTLKISYGINSPQFTTASTTISGSSGASTITVTSATGLVVGMRVYGTGIATNAYITDIVGTTVTLNAENTAAVSGTGTFTYFFYDSPKVNADTRVPIIVNSLGTINTEDYIVYDKSLSANSSDKNTGIVVGPGHSLMVYSSAADISYVVHGFEDITTDFTKIHYIRERSA